MMMYVIYVDECIIVLEGKHKRQREVIKKNGFKTSMAETEFLEFGSEEMERRVKKLRGIIMIRLGGDLKDKVEIRVL